MGCRHIAFALGAAVGAGLGAALFTSPVAYATATDLFPPGTIGPIGEPTNVQDVDASPFFEYKQSDLLYNVVDNGNTVGQFTDSSSFFESPYQPFLLTFLDQKDVISDSTYAGLADGATQEYTAWTLWGLGPTVLYAHNYLYNPGIETNDLIQIIGGFGNQYISDATGTSDVLTVFGQSFTLFDSPAVPAAGAELLDSSWLADLAALF
jgi:hypothetical protein